MVEEKKKAVPRFHATWNMSELKIRRADILFNEISQIYKLMIGGSVRDLKENIMFYISRISNANLEHIKPLGEDTELDDAINKLTEMAGKFTHRRRTPKKKPKDMIDLINFCLMRVNETAQKQGWGMGAERKYEDDDDDTWDFM